MATVKLSRREALLLILARHRFKRRQQVFDRKKRFWIRKIFKERKQKGEFHTLMKLYDHEYFHKQFRMSPQKLEELLTWVAPHIIKVSLRREAIGPEERLCVTLRYLATGDAQVTIGSSYRISPTSIGRIVSETTEVKWNVLKEKGFLKVPSTKDDWKNISYDFEKRWNFPHCIGAIDGKHIMIQAPANSGTLYYNYKKQFSIVLLTVCNANYEFLMVDIREAGRQSDGGVFARSTLGKSIKNNSLNILDNCDVCVPNVYIGDDAFPMGVNLMKPYPRNNLDDTKKLITNYRFSCARRVIENTFGIMTARFRVFRYPIHAKVETIENITKACVGIHNYLMSGKSSERGSYCPPSFTEDNGTGGGWRELTSGDTGLLPLRNAGSHNYSVDAKQIRDTFCDYFNSPVGEVHRQYDIISASRT